MKTRYMTLILIGLLLLAGVGNALAQNPNPGVIPNNGPMYGELGARWWQWAYSFSMAEVPFFNTGGPVDISEGQSGPVWFLAGANYGLPDGPRTGVVPSGRSLFFPLANYLDDYPCPDPNFHPAPGQTLEDFLQTDANTLLDLYLPEPDKDLFAEIDGVSLTDLQVYRATSSLFEFTADPALVNFDACIDPEGDPQPAVTVGYWLLLPPLTPGTHTLHFGVPSWGQDITYILKVTPGD